MRIERQNILDLIGKNKNKYSSCIITSYTFDFTFFEERIIPVLRTTNIKNINIFLDGRQLEGQLDSEAGNEYRYHKTYSLNPIYVEGAFHPKIMFLTGPKHGLMIIGSGNLTSSGMSTNDEVWGAFHLDSLDGVNSPIFASVWHYLEQYTKQANGFNKQKINWIYQRATWVNELVGLRNDSFVKINDELEIVFAGNTESTSIHDQLINHFPKENLKRVTIVSPYFDKEAKALEQIIKDYNPEVINCITDSEFGLLPNSISDVLNDQISFFDWKDCLKDFDKRFNRLHAKIFHFEYGNGWEYLMIGSANATSHALGTAELKPKNAEAGMIIKRKLTGGYMRDLGIIFDESKSFDVRTINRSIINKGDQNYVVKRKYSILHAERSGDKLSLYLKKALDRSCNAWLYSYDNELVEVVVLKEGEHLLKLELKSSGKAVRVVVMSQKSQVSNQCLIHDVAALAKCNPDPNQAELNQLLESMADDPEKDKFIDLLHHIDYNWVEDELSDTGSVVRGGSRKKRETEGVKRTYDEITEDEFNELQSRQSIDAEYLNNPTTQIADVISIISKGLSQKNEMIIESSEEALLTEAEDDRTGAGDEVSDSSIVQVRGEQIVKSINKHLDKVYKFYQSQLESLFDDRTFQGYPKRKLTIKDLSNISISMDLLYIFHGETYDLFKTEFVLRFNKKHIDKIADLEKSYKLTRLKKTNPDHVEDIYYHVDTTWFLALKKDLNKIDEALILEQNEYPAVTEEHYYLKEGVYNSKGYGVKDDVNCILGSFIMCANSASGFKTYDYDVLNEKMSSMRRSVFERSTFLILNLYWREGEHAYRMTLLLDLLKFIYPKEVFKADLDLFKEALEEQYKNAVHKGSWFEENLEYFLEEVFPSFYKWQELYNDKSTKVTLLKRVDDLRTGSVIFNQKIGFASVIKKGEGFIYLKKPGFKWDDIADAATLKVNYSQDKIIVL